MFLVSWNSLSESLFFVVHGWILSGQTIYKTCLCVCAHVYPHTETFICICITHTYTCIMSFEEILRQPLIKIFFPTTSSQLKGECEQWFRTWVFRSRDTILGNEDRNGGLQNISPTPHPRIQGPRVQFEASLCVWGRLEEGGLEAHHAGC